MVAHTIPFSIDHPSAPLRSGTIFFMAQRPSCFSKGNFLADTLFLRLLGQALKTA